MARSRPDLFFSVGGIGWGCADARGRPGSICGGGGCLGGATRARGLAWIFGIAVGSLQWGCAGVRTRLGRGGGVPGVVRGLAPGYA